MKYENRVVCFIDIIGFEALVNQTDNDESKIDSIVRALHILRNDHYWGKGTERLITHFSDSLVISYPTDVENFVMLLLSDILCVQYRLAYEEDILIRGGIVEGDLIHDEKKLFGPAFLKAYELESKDAIYPRIILDKSIIEVGEKYHTAQSVEKSINEMLLKDFDGMYYIDYFGAVLGELKIKGDSAQYPNYLKKLYDIISNGFKIENPSVREKYQWMKEKYNNIVRRLKEEYQQQSTENNLRQAYEDLLFL